MQNFFSANYNELNQNQEIFYRNLSEELQKNFYHYTFQVEPYSASKEQPLRLNNLGLKFLKIQPLHFENEKWTKDKNWIWDSNKIDLISSICAKLAFKHEFEFVGLNSDRDNYPLFIVRVASSDVEKDLLKEYDY